MRCGWTRWLLKLAGLERYIRDSRIHLTPLCKKIVTKPVVMRAISASVKFMASRLCIMHQNRKYINLWFCGLVAYTSLCLKSCTIPAVQLILGLEKLHLLCYNMFGCPIWLLMWNTLLLVAKFVNILRMCTSTLWIYCNHCQFLTANLNVVL